MLRLAELEALASSYRRDVAGRLAAPRAAEVRDRLARGCRDLAQAAGALGDFTRHELALVGTTAAEARKVGELLESWSAKSGAAACEVDARPARHDQVHEVALSQGLFGGTQQLFLESGELGQAHSKARVVAQRAQIAQMIRKTLQLQGKRSQPYCTWRYARSAHTLERLTISPRECDGGIAGDPRGQPVAFEQGQLGETPLDALVHIAEVLLEPEDLLAHDRKAEMARLDDARVHRSDRNLVDAFALDRHERVVINGKRGMLIGNCRIAQGMEGGGPRSMTQPRPLIRIGAMQAGEVGNGALHAACTGERLFEPRIVGLRSRQSQRQYEHTRVGCERGAHEVLSTGVATRPK